MKKCNPDSTETQDAFSQLFCSCGNKVSFDFGICFFIPIKTPTKMFGRVFQLALLSMTVCRELSFGCNRSDSEGIYSVNCSSCVTVLLPQGH